MQIVFDPEEDEALSLFATIDKHKKSTKDPLLRCQYILQQISERNFEEFSDPDKNWAYFPSKFHRPQTSDWHLINAHYEGETQWEIVRMYKILQEIKILKTAHEYALAAYRVRDQIALTKEMTARMSINQENKKGSEPIV